MRFRSLRTRLVAITTVLAAVGLIIAGNRHLCGVRVPPIASTVRSRASSSAWPARSPAAARPAAGRIGALGRGRSAERRACTSRREGSQGTELSARPLPRPASRRARPSSPRRSTGSTGRRGPSAPRRRRGRLPGARRRTCRSIWACSILAAPLEETDATLTASRYRGCCGDRRAASIAAAARSLSGAGRGAGADQRGRGHRGVPATCPARPTDDIVDRGGPARPCAERDARSDPGRFAKRGIGRSGCAGSSSTPHRTAHAGRGAGAPTPSLFDRGARDGPGRTWRRDGRHRARDCSHGPLVEDDLLLLGPARHRPAAAAGRVDLSGRSRATPSTRPRARARRPLTLDTPGPVPRTVTASACARWSTPARERPLSHARPARPPGRCRGWKTGTPSCASPTRAGAPPGLAARVFQRFFRVHASRARMGGGSGLGLATAGDRARRTAARSR